MNEQRQNIILYKFISPIKRKDVNLFLLNFENSHLFQLNWFTTERWDLSSYNEIVSNDENIEYLVSNYQTFSNRIVFFFRSVQNKIIRAVGQNGRFVGKLNGCRFYLVSIIQNCLLMLQDIPISSKSIATKWKGKKTTAHFARPTIHTPPLYALTQLPMRWAHYVWICNGQNFWIWTVNEYASKLEYSGKRE